MLELIYDWLYQLIQLAISLLFSPYPPPPRKNVDGPRIAIIGAGITGVSSAAHCIGHGAQPVIFEAGPREHLGGIWSVSRRRLY
jgi:NADPH-dependent glutamate synthase beta subunit-like oxidoreductase